MPNSLSLKQGGKRDLRKSRRGALKKAGRQAFRAGDLRKSGRELSKRLEGKLSGPEARRYTSVGRSPTSGHRSVPRAGGPLYPGQPHRTETKSRLSQT
jgi:hypothetical protein